MAQGTGPAIEPATASFSHVAHEVVAGARGGSFERDGATLSTVFQTIHCVASARAFGDEALLQAIDGGTPLPARTLFARQPPGARVRLDWTCRALHLRSYAVVDPGDRRLFLDVHPEALAEESESAAAFLQLVRFYGLVPERVCLQVLETTCGDEARLARAVSACRSAGFAVAVDHFGEGRSNFDRIALLRPDFVKVDRATLFETVGETRTERMLPGVVRVLKETGAEVVVNGVANAREAIAAIEAGADYLQGRHFGAPHRELRDEALSTQLVLSARRLSLS